MKWRLIWRAGLFLVVIGVGGIVRDAIHQRYQAWDVFEGSMMGLTAAGVFDRRTFHD
jgi:hypothetical protein